ncbi:hypothetical protein [Schleiferilactobacillus perolens]|nr:hypothetical protein [Schleiferilactobacillus perolens]
MMKEDMLWLDKSYASNAKAILQISKLRWVVVVSEFICGIILYSFAQEKYGQTAAIPVLMYLVLVALICLVGQSITMARVSQAIQLLSFSLTTGAIGGLVISVELATGSLFKQMPYCVFIGSLFIWLVIAAVVFAILYRKMLRGDFKKQMSAAKTKRIVRQSKTYSGILVMLIGGSSLFLHMAEKSQVGQAILWVMGTISSIFIAGMSGGLILLVLAKAKFPSFNIKIPSRRELREARRENAAANTEFKQRKQNGVFFQVNDVSPSESHDSLQIPRQHVSEWLKNE